MAKSSREKSEQAVVRKPKAVLTLPSNRPGPPEIQLTQEGFEKLRAELEHLRTIGRAEVAERIRAAKEVGDITDSAQYEAAKDDQAFLEGRIRALESQIGNARIITREGLPGLISLGSRVTITNGAGWERTLTVVDAAEASAAQGHISADAPVGKALLGRQKGDTVLVQAPSGPIPYTVLRVE
jgi:transcription elongation factor GreA